VVDIQPQRRSVNQGDVPYLPTQGEENYSWLVVGMTAVCGAVAVVVHVTVAVLHPYQAWQSLTFGDIDEDTAKETETALQC
jgi:hypothetical protein